MPHNARFSSVAGLLLLLSTALLLAPTDGTSDPPREASTLPHEFPPLHRQVPRVGPRRVAPPLPPAALQVGDYQSVQVNVDADGNNILDDAANEPSIAVDPTDPSRIVIGWRQFDSVLSDFRQAGWAYSHNGGYNWTFPGVLEPDVFRSDPVLDTDADGNFYYYSLSHTICDFCCEMFKSTDGGVSWTGPINARGGDKAWMTVDRTGGIGDGNVYCCWQRFANCCGDRVFTRSTNGGASFIYPRSIPSSPSFGVTAVGPDGEVYVAGIRAISSQDFEHFVVAKSTNAKNPAATPSFSTVDVDLGGAMRLSAAPNPAGLLGQAWVAVDHSTGATRGNVYVLCSVDPPGDDPLDVMFIRSVDGGQNWSTPLRINDDPADANNSQWFGTLSVAPNGRIDVIWNDPRNGPDDQWAQVFYSHSTDGGLTFSPNEPITPTFASYLGWPQQNKLGDYYDMISDNLGAHLTYAATFNGEQDVYYLRIGQPDCNGNGVADAQDVGSGTSEDCNANSIPDECEQDCNDSGQPDDCDIADGTSEDCNFNGVPDDCEAGWDQDCNDNGVPDLCDIDPGDSEDCNGNTVPDECDIADGISDDCNFDGVPDECELADATAMDCNGNGVLDECDLASGASEDCQPNGVLDDCEPTPMRDNCADAIIVCRNITYHGTTYGATNDGSAGCGESDDTPDVWYYYEPYGSGLLNIYLCGSSYDTVLSVHTGCPGTANNQIACSDDDCGLDNLQSQTDLIVQDGQAYWLRIAGKNGATGQFELLLSGPDCAFGPECNDNGIPDECEPDCNGNGRPDDCDIADGISLDADDNGVPDECEGLTGDLNCDQLVNAFDIDPFALALSDPDGYAAAYPECSLLNADANGDGMLNAFDIDPFVALLSGE